MLYIHSYIVIYLVAVQDINEINHALEHKNLLLAIVYSYISGKFKLQIKAKLKYKNTYTYSYSVYS